MRDKILCCLLVCFLLCSSLALTSVTFANPFNCGCQETERDMCVTTPALTGADVSELQLVLQKLGYYDGELNGKYQKSTAAAVQKFQAWVGLQTSGIFTAAERQALATSLAYESFNQATSPPPEGELRIEIDLERRTLTILVDDRIFNTYACAIGTSKTKTPVGEWRIIQKGTNWGGGFGTRWLGLNVPWGIYGIHGTNNPSSIGTAASAGCIRMQNRDVEQIYPWIRVGTRVSVLGPFPRMRINAPLRNGHNSKEVQLLQLSLREAGFNPGYTDGRYGPDTEAAVQKLQAFYGLRATGQADINVLNLLDLR